MSRLMIIVEPEQPVRVVRDTLNLGEAARLLDWLLEPDEPALPFQTRRRLVTELCLALADAADDIRAEVRGAAPADLLPRSDP